MYKKPSWDIKREIKVKSEEDTNPKYGCRPEKRSLNQLLRFGIIVIDKVPGPTSHEVASWIKKLLELDKAGHGGTLDPKVTGVLPITLQNSTKVVQALLESGKEYICVMRTHQKESIKRIINTLNLFKGEIYQRPPLRASVSRRLRTRYIYDIEFIEGDGNNWLFKTSCQSGTYIRKLCFDVGEVLGSGAHMQELRRIRSGPFREEQAITMYELTDAIDLKKAGNENNLRNLIHPVEDGLKLIPKLWVRDSAVEAICHGAQLAVPGITKYETGIGMNNLIAAFTLKDECIALMKSTMTSGQIQAKKHGIAAKPVRVIMPRGTYPKKW
jgi:H/ACA ribonucleoprotein complex subunit 4